MSKQCVQYHFVMISKAVSFLTKYHHHHQYTIYSKANLKLSSKSFDKDISSSLVAILNSVSNSGNKSDIDRETIQVLGTKRTRDINVKQLGNTKKKIRSEVVGTKRKRSVRT
jgi:hypothetical protein